MPDRPSRVCSRARDFSTRRAQAFRLVGIWSLGCIALLAATRPALRPLSQAQSLGNFPEVVLSLLLVAATLSDLKTGKIFNIITVPAALLGLVISGAPGGIGTRACLLGLGAGLGLCVVVRVLAGLGGGDVKLAAAIGALVGFPTILDVLLNSFLVAGLFAASVLVVRLGPRDLVGRAIQLAAWAATHGAIGLPRQLPRAVLATRLRLAPCFAVGTALCFL